MFAFCDESSFPRPTEVSDFLVPAKRRRLIFYLDLKLKNGLYC